MPFQFGGTIEPASRHWAKFALRLMHSKSALQQAEEKAKPMPAHCRLSPMQPSGQVGKGVSPSSPGGGGGAAVAAAA